MKLGLLSTYSVLSTVLASTILKLIICITNINPNVVIDFSATWCNPCKKIGPVFEELSKQYQNWTFCKVDVDLVPDAAEFYNVTCMPTFIFIKNSQVVGRVEGSNMNEVMQNLFSLAYNN